MDGIVLHPKDCIKYLGVHADNRLMFRLHIEQTVEKCQQRIPLLIHSLLMYCSSIYYHWLQLKTYPQKIDQLQRRTNIIICRGYRDISGGSAGLIAAEAPLALRLVERSVAWLLRKGRPVPHWGHLDPIEDSDDGLFHRNQAVSLREAKRLLKTNTMEKWEEEWAEYQYSGWTLSLFPTIKSRIETGLVPDFWTTQAITGHGVFKAYLKDRGRVDDNACPCGFGAESAEHVLRECLRFTDGRPLDWSQITPGHIQYMRRVVVELWKRENPCFTLRRYHTNPA